MAVLLLSLLMAADSSDTPGKPEIWLKADPKFAAAELRIAHRSLQRIDPADLSKLPQRSRVAIERIPKIRKLGWCVPYLRDFRRGNVGRIRGFFIQQIRDGNKAIVRVRYDGYSLREKSVVLTGYDFDGLADDEHVSIDIPIEVTGPESYLTGLGTKRTVHAVRVVDEDRCWAAAERRFSEEEQGLFREYLMLNGGQKEQFAEDGLETASVAVASPNETHATAKSKTAPRPADARLSSGESLGEVVHLMMDARSALKDFPGPPSVRAQLLRRARELSSRLALEPEWISVFGERRNPWTVSDFELIQKIVNAGLPAVLPAHVTDTLDQGEIATRLVSSAEKLRDRGSDEAADAMLKIVVEKYGRTESAAVARKMLAGRTGKAVR